MNGPTIHNPHASACVEDWQGPVLGVTANQQPSISLTRQRMSRQREDHVVHYVQTLEELLEYVEGHDLKMGISHKNASKINHDRVYPWNPNTRFLVEHLWKTRYGKARVFIWNEDTYFNPRHVIVWVK